MKKNILLTVAAAALLGLVSCGGGNSSTPSVTTEDTSTTSATSATTVESSDTSQAPAVFDGGVTALEVDVDCDIQGVVTQILGQGFTLADGKGAVYVYGSDSAKKVNIGDYVNVTGTATKYYGVWEITKPTVTPVEGGTRGLDDVVTDEIEITGDIATKFYDDVTACKASDSDPYPAEQNVPYFFEGLTATSTSKGIAFKVGDSERLLCPHYYLPEKNRTEDNQDIVFYEGCVYDVHFYLMGTNSTNNLDIHIYDVEAHFDPVESVTLDEESVSIEVGGSAAVTPTVLPATADQGLTYTIADETIATVNKGTVKGVAEGDTTLTVASVADPTKKAEIPVHVGAPTVEYELLLDFSFVKNDKVEVEYGDAIGDKGNYASCSYTLDGYNIFNDKAGNTGGANGWKSAYSSVRLYKSTTVTFTAPEGVEIAKVELTCDDNDNNKYVPAEGEDYGTGVTLSVVDTVATFTLAAPANSFTLTMAKQIRPNDVKFYKVK